MPSAPAEVPSHIAVRGIYTVPANDSRRSLTIRVTEILSARRMESGTVIVIVMAYRVRPYDHSVSFGREHCYVSSPDRFVKVG